jgi:hypothetical protein
MVLGGVSQAMAQSTALCKADEEPCKAGNLTTEVHYEAEDILIHTSVLDYECDALLSATVLKLGAPQALDVQSLKYTNCNQGCTRTAKSLGSFSVLRNGAETADITAKGFEIEVKCGIYINCTYSFENLIGTVLGPLLTGDNGHITYEEASLPKIGGIACPEVAKLNALFVALTPVYVKS